MTELYVTNFNRNFTGVSSTITNVVRQQAKMRKLELVGRPLPDCQAPISQATARRLSRDAPANRPFSIWHVRRNTEMRAALWARDVLRLPIRIVFTSAAQRRHSAFPRWLISRMDAVVATTEKAASYVPHVRAVVPHGVDTDVFCPPENRLTAWESLGYGGKIGIATIGRIRPEKGTDQFVEAMLHLLPQQPDATALVLGRAGREHQGFLKDLKTRVAAAGLADRILFPGEIRANELPKVMRALSLVMQLPRYEGFGMVPLEGLASAVPFVGSDAGYYRAFSAQGTTGSIVRQDTPADAAEAARCILSDSARYQAMSTKAREVAVESFSAAREAQGIEAVYQELWAKG